MNAALIATLLGQVIQSLFASMNPQQAKELIDDVLDIVERKVEESETKLDDATVLPALAFLRRVINVPDDIGGDED